MRLKALFFPMAVVMAVSIGIGYVYPNVTSAIEKYDLLDAKKKALSAFNANKVNIAKLEGEISANADKKEFVMGYLPETLDEEKVINWIDRIAQEKSLLLVSVTFEKKAPVVDGQPVAEPAHTALANEMNSGNTAAQAGSQITSLQTVMVADKKIKEEHIIANVEVMGKYDKLLEMLNTLGEGNRSASVQAVSIEHIAEKDAVKAGADDQSVGAADSSKAPSDLLQAKLEIVLNYAPKTKLQKNYALKVFDEKTFAETFSKLKIVMTEGTRLPDLRTTVSGERTNPFLP